MYNLSHLSFKKLIYLTLEILKIDLAVLLVNPFLKISKVRFLKMDLPMKLLPDPFNSSKD